MLIGSVAAHRLPEMAGRRGSTFLQRRLKAFATWRRRRRERAELYALSDAALKDFGVSWTEIEAIVSSDNRDASGRLR
jgi:uncharacterized protein YjiS (DUF1127 family)